MLRLFESSMAHDARVYLVPTVQGLSEALVDLPQDLIQAGQRLVAIIRESPMDFAIYEEVFSQLASRCRVIRRRLADGPVFTFTHLSTLAQLIHDLCRDLKNGQDLYTLYLATFGLNVDQITKSWFSEVGTLAMPPHLARYPVYFLNDNGHFEKVEKVG